MAATHGKVNDGKERANGYNHTYFDTGNANFNSLASYLTDKELERCAVQAHLEAQELFFLLGIAPAQLTKHVPVLPGIESFVTLENREDLMYDSDTESDAASENGINEEASNA